MQAACHDLGGTIIALCYADHGGSSEQTERRESFGLFTSTGKTKAPQPKLGALMGLIVRISCVPRLPPIGDEPVDNCDNRRNQRAIPRRSQAGGAAVCA
jgi:hypothetical protein